MEDLEQYGREAVALRRKIHRRPEEGWTEFETEWLVVNKLRELGWTLRTGTQAVKPEAVMGRSEEIVAKAEERAREHGVPQAFLDEIEGYTGVIAEFDTGRPGPFTGFRFDMDCVMVDESKDASHLPAAEGFGSEIPGSMHACGHDGHTASGLALAHWIVDNKDKLCGRFRLIFQPAEEGTRGGYPMAQAGAVDGLDWFYGAHVGVYCGPGELGVCTGGFLATTKIDIRFTGIPSHAGSDPEKGRSALTAAASAALMMQGIPRHGEGTTRIAVGKLIAGEGRNVTPVHALLQVETRGSTHEINQFMAENVRRIAEGCADAVGVKVEVSKAGEATTLKTTEEGCRMLNAVCNEVVPGHVKTFDSCNGSEDCTWLCRRAVEQGAQTGFFLFGCRHHGHHRSDFEIQDTESLPLALKVFTGLCNRINGR